MINFIPSDAREEFEKLFGFSIDTLNPNQIWWLVKLSKHVRGRCRNNSAFNNYFSQIFKKAKFKTIPKEYKGRVYNGLQISVDGFTFNTDDRDEG